MSERPALVVDEIRQAERRGIRAVLAVLTSPMPGNPGVLEFRLPDGAHVDQTVVMRKIEAALTKERMADEDIDDDEDNPWKRLGRRLKSAFTPAPTVSTHAR